MRFAQEIWLWGVFLSLGLGLILALQGFRLTRDRARFGNEALLKDLVTAKTGVRRAIRGAMACLAVALAFVAAAQPQYGKGTKILPATNLDVVIVLDYSKSMYARDVSPSRSARAKVEVTRLIRELGGARFAAVAFAGESISFPLTSDGSAIAQFFRGMEPNDLPVGGTAIARALESGRQLLARDPLSKNHEKVMILVTDGEDLEGDPVLVAKTAAEEGIRVDVVQIGGRSPEPIPSVDEHGVVQGMRKDANGQILTTQLSVAGEAQLAGVASSGGGTLVRAEAGSIGIDELTKSLRRLMTEELSQRVETVFADVFHYPLILAVLLLSTEVWIGTAKVRVIKVDPPKGQLRRRRPSRLRASAVLFALLSLGCHDVDELFKRESPLVADAINALSTKSPDRAVKLLTEYLETGPCEAGVIGAGERARNMGDASLDLALAFSALSTPKTAAPQDPAAALAQGQLPPQLSPPTPDPNAPGGLPPGPEGQASPPQIQNVDCALRILAPIGANLSHPVALRARAHYLAGNLELLRADYEAAVTAYDAAILLAPGVKKGVGDPIGISIAYNRALALRLLKEKKEEEKKKNDEQDKSNQEKSDQDKDKDDSQNQDGDKDQEKQEPPPDEEKSGDDQDKKDDPKPEDEPKPDEAKDPGEKDKQQDESGDNSQKEPPQDQKNAEQPEGEPESSPEQAAQGPSESRDQRMLDLLEQAPTLQQHEAQKRRDEGVRVRATMEDK